MAIDSTKIAQLCLKHFEALPKSGKPKENEWTVLSCIVKEQHSSIEVVALGTGTKCIGKTKICPKGTIVNDSHAEVICRRSFLRYLLSEINLNSSIFCYDENKIKFSLKSNVKFHFFTTHTPCGDGAIFSKDREEDFGDIVISRNLEHFDTIPHKRRKIEREDIFRTGAKCLKDDVRQDLKQSGSQYHVIGVVRTKPGRGDPTISVSCSDKISRWCHLGVQGSLLMLFLESPIYLSTFIITGDTPFCKTALKRAFYDRIKNIDLLPPFGRKILDIFQVDLKFIYRKCEEKQPCPSSISWFLMNKEKYSEIAVNGKKQGATNKNFNSEKGTIDSFTSFSRKQQRYFDSA